MLRGKKSRHIVISDKSKAKDFVNLHYILPFFTLSPSNPHPLYSWLTTLSLLPLSLSFSLSPSLPLSLSLTSEILSFNKPSLPSPKAQYPNTKKLHKNCRLCKRARTPPLPRVHNITITTLQQAMARNSHKTRFLNNLLLFLIILSIHVVASLAKVSESEALSNFKKSLSNSTALSNWDVSMSPCNTNGKSWVGVICSNGKVYGLQLENMGLGGVIDTKSLADLQSLRTLSFMNNNFEGPMPEINKLGALKSVFLSNNRFSGPIPDGAFDGMLSLKKLHLARNQFSGEIPMSLTKLPKLLELKLEGNQFGGRIPDFGSDKELKSLNLSNNALDGPIPASLVKMDSSAFSGNKNLCGEPLKQPCDTSKPPTAAPSLSPSNANNSLPPPPPASKGVKMTPLTIVTAIVFVGLAIAAIIAGIFILRCRKQSFLPPLPNKLSRPDQLNRMEQGSSPDNQSRRGGGSPRSGKKASSDSSQSGKLSFLRDDRERFDLQDLLKASAEILGSGYFGSSYKATLVNGLMMVVKRYRQMNNVGKEEFHEQMRRLGRLRHPNLLPLVAYYYRKEEKLVISDYVELGSLAVHLHGNKSRGKPSPDWPTRLKIVKGVAKGLLYLYNELPNIVTPHGHLKSSNVLLDESFEPLLTDYGLIPVMNQEHAQELMVAYRSPEYTQHGRITKKTDVWSLGMLILEILTGRFASNFLQQGKGDNDSDLATWVNKIIVRDEGVLSEVFDSDMEGRTAKYNEGEMIKLLKIGLACCESDVDERLDLKVAVERIEELRDHNKDNEDDFYSSYASEGDIVSSRGVSDDFNFTG